jgi:hypothetical protein
MKLAIAFAASLAASAVSADITIKCTNKLPIERKSQTVELKGIDLAALNTDLNKIHIKDSSGKELIAQAVDTDLDEMHKPDILIFQADFAPNQSKSFTALAGGALKYKLEDIKAHGRFVRERFDDFAWENDRIAHRTYGKALITWKGEPLTSSSIDIWSKRTPKMVIDEWYMVDNYHTDTGEGADFYSAGATRGCGGDGLWADNKLVGASNFVDSRVYTNGPIRVMFELVYEPFDVGGTKVSEIRRITLDAGSNLDHIQCFYKPQGEMKKLTAAVGLKKTPGAKLDFNEKAGTLTDWEKVEKNQGMQGLAIIADPKLIQKQTEDEKNHLLLLDVGSDNSINYWAGFFWDKTKQFDGYDAWKKYVDETAQGAASPIEVSVGQ